MVALKKTKFLRIGEGMPGYALKEINILKQLNHPSVVRLLDVVNDGLKGEKLALSSSIATWTLTIILIARKKSFLRKDL